MTGRDWVALVVSITVGIIMVILVFAVAISPEKVDEATGHWLGVTIGFMVGAVTTYIGFKQRDKP
jgi:hypothetical protein